MRCQSRCFWYRQQMQWLGGVGVIVLAVALVPVLGIGGMQLYKADAPGPVKDEKLTPRITQTARALWGVYVLLTAACTVAYLVSGMDWFDALAPRLLDRLDRRLLAVRRRARALSLGRDRLRRGRIHVSRRRQFRTALRRLAPEGCGAPTSPTRSSAPTCS